MSVRDEIEAAIRQEAARRMRYPRAPELADALLPIVERVARNTIEAYKRSGLSCQAQECEACQGAIDAIVAGVIGRE